MSLAAAGRAASAVLVPATLALLLLGCSARITDFSFDSNGTQVTLTSRDRAPRGAQGTFLPAHGRPTTPTLSEKPELATPRYELGSAHTTHGEDFYISYSGASGPLELHVYETASTGGATTQTTVPLPLPPASTHTGDPSTSEPPRLYRYLLPLSDGTGIKAFQVTSSSPSAEIKIQGAGLTPDFDGVSFGKQSLSLREGVRVDESFPRPNETETTIEFPSLVSAYGKAQAQVVLTYTDSGGNGPVRLIVTGPSDTTKGYSVVRRRGTHNLYLYTAGVGFTPQGLRVTSEEPGFHLDSVTVHRFDPPSAGDSSLGATNPIPADFGAIIDYGPDYWRQKGYELFSWSLIPSVLVMQFSSYAVQALYMKRFAFFIEKHGFAGKLWTDEQLSHFHGWNAHDYRPEDLARFYSTAEKENFPLHPEERHLEKILIANGLIIPKGNAFEAGSGAILTFAHVGPYWLRRLLLTHEGYHGVFFTHPAYRQAVFSIWKETKPGEQKLFRDIFLNYARYNIDDPYLVQNEFQAYLMQQPLASVQGYFDNELSYEMKRMGIPASSPLVSYLATHPEAFRSSAIEVQKAVENAVGVSAGELVGLSPS